MKSKALKAILAYFALKILIWSRGKEILTPVSNAMSAKEQPSFSEIPSSINGVSDHCVTMMQNQHLAGILLAMGVPPREAEIRSEIFGFKDMPMIREKLYWFPPKYWVDV